MNEIYITIKQKAQKPVARNCVSSIFANSKKRIEQREEKERKSLAKKVIIQNLEEKNRTAKESATNKTTKTSPFLELLEKKKKNEFHVKVVPTPRAVDEDIPINGFGEMCLKIQGWREGDSFGSDITTVTK